MDWHDAEEVSKLYKETHSSTMRELNEVIVMLRTRITFLERQLQDQIDSANQPIPAHISYKISQLEDINKNLKKELKERDKVQVPRFYENEFKKLMKENEDLKSDIEFYKSKVPVQVIINKEDKKKPTRRGGVPK